MGNLLFSALAGLLLIIAACNLPKDPPGAAPQAVIPFVYTIPPGRATEREQRL